MATNEFHCPSPACRTHFTAPSRAELVDQMIGHVKVKHRVPAPTRPILQFLQDNTITVVSSTGGRS